MVTRSAEPGPTRAEEIRDGLAHLHRVDPVLAVLIDELPDGRSRRCSTSRRVLPMGG